MPPPSDEGPKTVPSRRSGSLSINPCTTPSCPCDPLASSHTGLRPVPGNPKGSSALAGALKRAPVLGDSSPRLPWYGPRGQAVPWTRGGPGTNGLHLYLQVLKVPSALPSSSLAVPPHPSLGRAGLQNPLPNGLSPRGNAFSRPTLPPRSPFVSPGPG